MNLTNFDQTIPYFAARGTRPITDSLLQPRRVGRRLVIEPRQKTQCTGDTLPTRSSGMRNHTKSRAEILKGNNDAPSLSNQC